MTLFSQFGNYHWSLDLWVTFVLLTSFNVRLLYALGVQEGSFGVTFSPMSSHFSVNVVFFMKKCSRIAHHLSWTSETTLNTDHMHCDLCLTLNEWFNFLNTLFYFRLRESGEHLHNEETGQRFHLFAFWGIQRGRAPPQQWWSRWWLPFLSQQISSFPKSTTPSFQISYES